MSVCYFEITLYDLEKDVNQEKLGLWLIKGTDELIPIVDLAVLLLHHDPWGEGGGETPLYKLTVYGYVWLWRVWFSGSLVWEKVIYM